MRIKSKKQFLEAKTHELRIKYHKQRNICVSIRRKAKRRYYENFHLKRITDNLKLWVTIKSLFRLHYS